MIIYNDPYSNEIDNEYPYSYNDEFIDNSINEHENLLHKNNYEIKKESNSLLEEEKLKMDEYSNYLYNISENENENEKENYINNKEGSINNFDFMQKKRNLKEKIFEITHVDKRNKTTNNTDKENNLYNKNSKGNKKGRKNKMDKNDCLHNNESDDNIIRKIKVHLFKYALKIINQNFEKKSNKLLKLDYHTIMNLKQSINLDLLNKKLKQIFLEIKISDKYKHHKDNENEILINKIYDNKRKFSEEKVKKIFDLTLLELLHIFRGKINKNNENIKLSIESKLKGVNLLIDSKYEGIESFINNLKENEKYSENYINNIKYFAINYENWFENKIGRDKFN